MVSMGTGYGSVMCDSYVKRLWSHHVVSMGG